MVNPKGEVGNFNEKVGNPNDDVEIINQDKAPDINTTDTLATFPGFSKTTTVASPAACIKKYDFKLDDFISETVSYVQI